MSLGLDRRCRAACSPPRIAPPRSGCPRCRSSPQSCPVANGTAIVRSPAGARPIGWRSEPAAEPAGSTFASNNSTAHSGSSRPKVGLTKRLPRQAVETVTVCAPRRPASGRSRRTRGPPSNCRNVDVEVGENLHHLGVDVIRRGPAGPRLVLALRVEPALRETLEREAKRRGVSRSALVRDALIRTVDQRVLEEAPKAERLEAIRRGMEADVARLRPVFGIRG
ncbi:MAG: CopG family transcriptional regulator [Solirubrobacteraceae bacterium]